MSSRQTADDDQAIWLQTLGNEWNALTGESARKANAIADYHDAHPDAFSDTNYTILLRAEGMFAAARNTLNTLLSIGADIPAGLFARRVYTNITEVADIVRDIDVTSAETILATVPSAAGTLSRLWEYVAIVERQLA